jgi:transposase InsO family protein
MAGNDKPWGPLKPDSVVDYAGHTWRIEAVHPTEYHLAGSDDPTSFTVVRKSDVQPLIDNGQMVVREEFVGALDFTLMSEATRKRTASNLLWVLTAEQARVEGKIADYSRTSLTRLIAAEAGHVSEKHKAYLADKSVSVPTKLRKASYGAFSKRRSGKHRDIDPGRLIPGPKTLGQLLAKWEQNRHIQALIPNWGNQRGGGREIDARTWSFISKNCMIYARENNRTIAGALVFINALIVHENEMLGPEAQIPKASEHAIRKAITDIPEFCKLFTRRGPGRMAQRLRHVGNGPKFTRLGEEVLFDCWEAHIFTLLSDEVLALFPNAVRDFRIQICVAIDQATNYIPAFSASPTGETAALTCRVLEMVATDKKAYARAAGSEQPWEAIPVETAGVDNGGAFWSMTFQHALYVLADSVDHKAAGKKHLRAKIERVLRTIDVRYLQHFIARTGSTIHDRHENDPDKRAAIYVDFFMRLFVRFILDVYHFTAIDKGRKRRLSPARALEQARKIQCKALPGADWQRMAFGIVTERTLNRAGIRFMNIVYYSTWLDEPLWLEGPHQVTIKYHTRNLGRISVLLNNRWVTIPGPRELEGKDLQTWIEYNDEIARQVSEQAEVDFRTIVAPALLDIDAGARQAERDLNLTSLDWTDAMATEAERCLRTFIVYDRDVIGEEKGVSGQSEMLGATMTRSIGVRPPADLSQDGQSAPPSPTLPTEPPDAGVPVVRRPPRPRNPLQ